MRPLEPEAADQWAGPVAVLHDHLHGDKPRLPDDPTLNALPFVDRYRRRLPHSPPDDANDTRR